MEFMRDTPADGCAFRALNIIGAFAGARPGDRSGREPASRARRAAPRAARRRVWTTNRIAVDNGPDFQTTGIAPRRNGPGVSSK